MEHLEIHLGHTLRGLLVVGIVEVKLELAHDRPHMAGDSLDDSLVAALRDRVVAVGRRSILLVAFFGINCCNVTHHRNSFALGNREQGYSIPPRPTTRPSGRRLYGSHHPPAHGHTAHTLDDAETRPSRSAEQP
jgi:hypothetical protein